MAAVASPSISRRSMLRGSRRGSGMLPSLAITTWASRRRASWRMARSTTRRPPTCMRAPDASCSVALRMIGTSVRVATTAGRESTAAARAAGFSSPAPSIIIMRQSPPT